MRRDLQAIERDGAAGNRGQGGYPGASARGRSAASRRAPEGRWLLEAG